MSASSKGVPNDKNGKKVGQYLNGELMRTYSSVREAERQTGIRWIGNAARSNFKKSAGGFFWQYILKSETVNYQQTE